MMTMLKCLVFLLAVMFSTITYAVSGAGSCVEFKFPTKPDDKEAIDTSIPIRVLRNGASLYQGLEEGEPIKPLAFDAVFKPLKLSPRRIQVAERDSPTNPIGWVEKSDLLCNRTPLLENGLARKAFIKVPLEAESNFAVHAYPTPDQDECSPSCKELSRFTTYFVFAEDDKRLLFSQAYNLYPSGTSAPLVGWVDREKAISWNTNLGLRPKENVEKISGSYSPEDHQKPPEQRGKGVELTGGNIWYTFPLHIPLIDKEGQYYKVTAPGIGMRGFNPLNTGPLEKMKQTDIFFLLDGTASMDPYIRAAKATAEQITSALRKQEAFRETTFRCGFLVYRDDYASNITGCNEKGICPGMSLTSSACDSNTEETSCGNEFEEKIRSVKASVNDGDDYPERLFDGLKATISQVTSCKDNNKILIVMGDHGDREEVIPQATIDEFKRHFEKLAIYFIQTANNVTIAKNSGDYTAAYEKFTLQAHDVIDRVIPKETDGKISERQAISREDYFLSLSEKQLPEKIAQDIAKHSVTPYSNSAFINEMQLALDNGQSLKDFYTKYRRTELEKGEYQGEMPVLYWEWIEKTVCEQLGEQCTKPANHRVMEFYVPADETLFEQELMLLERHIDKWMILLAPVTTLSDSTTELKQRFKEAILEGITKVLGEPPIAKEDEYQSLKEVIMKHRDALPIRPGSPLFEYSLKDVEDMQDCELLRLIEWVKSAHSILEKVLSNPTLKVSFDLISHEEYAKNQGASDECPGLSDKGKKLKKVVFKERQKLGPDDTYRYGHSLQGRGITMFWLPLEFLP